MRANKIYCMDAREGLRKLPDESIDCVVTSPPYWALRDYNNKPSIWDADEQCSHDFISYDAKLAHENRQNLDGGTIGNPSYREKLHGFGNARAGFCRKCGAWKGCLGLEPNFELYIKHLCDIFDEIKRILKRTGTLWVSLGDTYVGSCCGYAPCRAKEKQKKPREKSSSWPRSAYQDNTFRSPSSTRQLILRKSLCQITARFTIEMASRQWILRNEIIWHKPNCMPSSTKDRFTVDFDKLFFFVKSARYYFNADAVKEQASSKTVIPKHPSKGKKTTLNKEKVGVSGSGWADAPIPYRPMYRNKRCVWRIPTKPFHDAHFAVFPEELVETPIKAGCPKQVCKKCGTPRLVIDTTSNPGAFNIRVRDVKVGRIKHTDRNASSPEVENYNEKNYTSKTQRKVMFSCDCRAGFSPGIVLDPFSGAGTTLAVAKRLNRQYLGFEINHNYVKLAQRRLRGQTTKGVKE